MLAWHRRLVAKKFDGSKKNRARVEPSPKGEAIQELVLRLARDNGHWGYRRIAGALRNLGHEVSHQTVANILKGYGIQPAPERGKCMSWRDFIRSHLEVLAAVDFFTAEVWTTADLTTYYVLTCMRVASRQVWIAGITTSPDQHWMEQMARNLSMAEVGFLRKLPLSPARPRCQVLHCFRKHPQNRGHRYTQVATAKPESECPFGKMAPFRAGRVPIEVNPLRASLSATRPFPVRFAFSRGTQSPRQGQCDSVPGTSGSGW
jgi:hypothetical protein